MMTPAEHMDAAQTVLGGEIAKGEARVFRWGFLVGVALALLAMLIT